MPAGRPALHALYAKSRGRLCRIRTYTYALCVDLDAYAELVVEGRIDTEESLITRG